MCGIAGFVGTQNEGALLRMTSALAHRGPDGQGIWIDPIRGVHFGHRRLAIIDIATGDQPMWNEDGNVGVVFNGEIYNHVELRAQLVAKGHVFQSDHSDTETLVHGYEEWGNELPLHLNGMFAFAIIDRRAGRLFLARDRFGEKPLYWGRTKDGIAFASELTALALHPDISREIDELSLQKFFAHGFIPAPSSLLKGVRKLPAGSWLDFSLDDRKLVEKRYWRFQIEADESLGASAEARLVEELREHLFNAVNRRMISDVPLGLFLSGGVDSTAALAFARQARPDGQINTYNIGFSEASYDESGFAREAAEYFRAVHAVEMLELDDAATLVPEVLGRLDEPLGDPSIVPTFLLARFTRRHVTVALSGDGGDELFAGYDPFAALRLAEIYSKLVPRFAHAGAKKLVDLLPRSDRNMSLDYKLRRTLLGLSYPKSLWNPVWLSPMSPELIRWTFESPLSAEELYSEVIEGWDASEAKGSVDRTLEFYTNFYLQDQILVKTDRATMMNSLESRAIFLDNDLVQFAQRLPAHFKMRNKSRKYILKQALRGIVPDFVLDRAKKGFGIPLKNWLRTLDVVTPSSIPGGISRRKMGDLTQKQRDGRSDERLAVWAWTSYKQYLNSHQV